MKHFSKYGFKDFVIAAGYKRKIIENYFKKKFYNLNVNVIDTGLKTMTGGRVKRLQKFVGNETCMLTYGDGLSDVNLNKLKKFHESHRKIATVTAVHPPVRFGELEIINDSVTNFEEKPQAKAGWINGGFFVLNYKIFNYIKDGTTMFERQPMSKLANEGKLMAFKHNGFWKCMDTLRDKIILDKMWNEKKALWKK